MISSGNSNPELHSVFAQSNNQNYSNQSAGNKTISVSKPISERLRQFLEQLDLSLRRIDAGLM